ncbi:MAG: hypothetical protein ACI841_000784 [Planctomycetota bacterium]
MGFLRFVDDGAVERSNAQGSVRVEVLRGEASLSSTGELRLHLDSLALPNDPRLIRTRRIITMCGDDLQYVKPMTTHATETPDFLQHFEAQLIRKLD